MTNQYGNELLHKVLLDAMKDIDKICRENRLKYYLFAGSLLGAINHKGFIPWDDDVDIVLLPNDFDTLYKIVISDYSDKYSFETFDTTENCFSMMSKLRILGTSVITSEGQKSPIFVDINVLHNMPDKPYQRLFQRKTIELCNLFLGVHSGMIVPTSFIGKTFLNLGAKLGKKRLGKILKWALSLFDNSETEYVGIMCNTITANPYTGRTGYDNDELKRIWITDPIYLPFEDTAFMTIKDPEADLDARYGPHWRDPYPEEKRITKHDIKTYEISPEVMERIK